MTRSWFVTIGSALVLLAVQPADGAAQEPAAAAIEVVLTGPLPERRPDGKLPEGWDEARLERADGVFLDGTRITLHRLSELAAARGDEARILVRCEPEARFARLAALHDVLAAPEGLAAKLHFLAADDSGAGHRLLIVMDSFSGISIVNGEVIFDGTMGEQVDLEAEAEPGDEALSEEERDQKRQERLSKRRLELRLDVAGWFIGGEEVKDADPARRLEKLAERIAARKKDAGRAYLRIHVPDSYSCVELAGVFAAAEAAGADRIKVVDDESPFDFLRLMGFGARGDPVWLPRVVENGLKALARSQQSDGAWKAAPGSEIGQLGTSALAMLAFLGEFHSPTEGAFKQEVKRGFDFLVSRQRENGSIVDREEGFSFAHVLATYALVETYGLTGEDEHEGPAEKALAFLLRCRNDAGVWGLVGADPKGDLVVSAWAVLLLRAAQDNGFEVPDEVFAPVMAWLDGVTAKNGRPGSGADGASTTRLRGIVDPFYGRHLQSLTAVAGLARSRARGEHDPDERIGAALELITAAPPDDGSRFGPADLDYLLFGALLMNVHGDGSWTEWHNGLDDAVQAHFRELQGEAEGIRGLLDADPARIGLLTICLELSYRFSRNPASQR